MGKCITVIGTGYVGLTTSVLLAQAGYKVFALDINQDRLSKIKQGKSFFFEEGMDQLLGPVVRSGQLIATDSYEESIPNSDFVFSCVGTPDNPDGSSNLSYVFKAAEQAAEHMKNGTVFTQKSTVPVGTGEQVERLFKDRGKQIAYVSNPEFLREGTAISDTLGFDRIVAGGDDKQAVEAVLDLYRDIEKQREMIAKHAGITLPSHRGSYIATNRNSAELIKVTANAFLALKISFANSIAKLADHSGADINAVMDAVGADHRIGRAFLNAGRGYGGGCFPKDVSGLISSATEHGVELGIMTAAADLNESMPGYIANKVLEYLGSFEDKKVAILGLAFKAGTSDARRSPGVKLANILSHDGARVRVYDPRANEEARQDLRKGVEICPTQDAALKEADAVIIATDWPEFTKANLKKYQQLMSGDLFYDAMNVFDRSKVSEAGLKYSGVGRS